MRNAILVLLVVLLAAGAITAGDRWLLIREKDGIEIFENSTAENGYREFRGVARLDASFEEITMVLKDIPGNVHWLPACRRSDEIRWLDEHQVLVYIVNRAPWPIRDRDCVWKRHYVVDTDRHFRLEFAATEEPFDGERGLVRMTFARGVWEAKRLGPSSAEVTFQYIGDGGGNIPRSFINANNRKLPHRVLTALVGRIEELRQLPEEAE
jgi:hypothetical protein